MVDIYCSACLDELIVSRNDQYPVLRKMRKSSTYQHTTLVTLNMHIIFHHTSAIFRSCRRCSIKWRCSIKNLFLKISQYSRENNCVVVSFLIKLHV